MLSVNGSKTSTFTGKGDALAYTVYATYTSIKELLIMNGKYQYEATFTAI